MKLSEKGIISSEYMRKSGNYIYNNAHSFFGEGLIQDATFVNNIRTVAYTWTRALVLPDSNHCYHLAYRRPSD